MDDKVAVADGIVMNGQLDHAVEHQSPTAGAPVVETEHELVEVAGQVGLVKGALMGAQQPPLGQRGDPVDGGQHGILSASLRDALAAPVADVAMVA